MSPLNILKELLNDHFSHDAVERAEAIKRELFPDRLFKYRTFDADGRNLEALENNKLWCSSPFGFNDPYDCSLHFAMKKLPDVMRRALEKLNNNLSGLVGSVLFSASELDEISQSEDPTKTTTEVLRRKGLEELAASSFYEKLQSIVHEPRDMLEKSMRDGLYVGSLCERHDSMLMWAHYTENHKGFAIEYDLRSKEAESFIGRLWPVFYQKDVYDISGTIFGEGADYINDMFMIGAATVKSDEWAYEREWRIVLLRNPPGKGVLLDVPKPAAIYLGAQIEDKNREKIIKIAAERDVAVFCMERERGSFRLSARQL